MEGDFFRANRERLLALLPEASLAVFFAGGIQYRSADSMYRFTPNRNYYYLTGLPHPNGALLLGKEGGERFEIAFIDRPAPELEKLWGPALTAEEIAESTGIGDIRYTGQIAQSFAALLYRRNFEYIYADVKKMAFDGRLTEADLLLERLGKSYGYLQIRDGGRLTSNLRQSKTPGEIKLLRTAARETVAGMAGLIRKIRPGAWTYELRAEFEYYLTRKGMEGSIFLPVITSGANINYLHYIPDGLLRDGELLLVDLGAEYRYYGADICRVYPVNGKFSPIQKFWYQTLLEAYREIQAALRPGITLKDIENMGARLLADRLKADKKIREDRELRQYLPHGITHFLGMDNHDPSEDCPLAPGMLIAVEPGLYFKDLGFGMRIEDSILITDNGCDILTKDLASDVEAIESQMEP